MQKHVFIVTDVVYVIGLYNILRTFYFVPYSDGVNNTKPAQTDTLPATCVFSTKVWNPHRPLLTVDTQLVNALNSLAELIERL